MVGAPKHIWHTSGVYPKPFNMAEIVLSPTQPNIVVAVFPTGGGKLYLILIIDVVECVIALIFIPLLTRNEGCVRSYRGRCEMERNGPSVMESRVIPRNSAYVLLHKIL